MADINLRPPTGSAARTQEDVAAEAGGPPGDEALIELVELLFFAYRDFIGDPDVILNEIGFGRAHHRVLHFVTRNPGLRVTDLLDLLKITKQSLGRVLKQLVEEGYIEQIEGHTDRRQRLLHPTARGRALAGRLAEPQIRRFSDALADLDAEEAAVARQFLMSLVNEAERGRVARLVGGARNGGAAKGERP